MNPFLSLMRPSVCMLSVLGLLVGAIVSGAFTFLLIPAIIAVFLITGAGNVINDYYDYKIDKINAPHRPIPAGRIKRKTALYFFLAINLIGLVLSFLINPYFLAIALVNAVLLTIYSWKLKPIALIGNIVVSWLAASTFIAASLLTESIPLSILILASISFLGTLSREILKDVKDIKGDKKLGAKTLPILVGKKPSQFLSYMILLIAVFSLWLPISYKIFSQYYYLGALPAVILCFLSIFFHKKIDLSQKLIKYAMYFVFLGFILGSIL